MSDVEKRDYSKTIKRLELIKSLISLEEENEINIHVERLEQEFLTTEIKQIIIDLKNNLFGKAVLAIDELIRQNSKITFFVDPKLEALKFELKFFEGELNALSFEKANLEKKIHEFEIRHNKELGELILKILRFKQAKAVKGTPEQQEADEDYNSYYKEFQASRDDHIATLTEDELIEIKNKYRRASKLCHPDVVGEEQKDFATELFAELSVAYEKNNLKKVKEILENLEEGKLFVRKSGLIDEYQMTQSQIEVIRLAINEIKNQIKQIKASDVFIIISSIVNMNKYFDDTRQKLFDELMNLKQNN